MVPYGRLVCNGKAKGADEMAICGNKVGTLMKMESGKTGINMHAVDSQSNVWHIICETEHLSFGFGVMYCKI